MSDELPDAWGQVLNEINQKKMNIYGPPPTSYPKGRPMQAEAQANPNLVTLAVEKCENGYVIKSGGTIRIASSVDDLKEQFIALLVSKKLT